MTSGDPPFQFLAVYVPLPPGGLRRKLSRGQTARARGVASRHPSFDDVSAHESAPGTRAPAFVLIDITPPSRVSCDQKSKRNEANASVEQIRFVESHSRQADLSNDRSLREQFTGEPTEVRATGLLRRPANPCPGIHLQYNQNVRAPLGVGKGPISRQRSRQRCPVGDLPPSQETCIHMRMCSVNICEHSTNASKT